MLAMGLNTEEEGSAMAFLRRGYKARACAALREAQLARPGGVHSLPAE